MPINVQALFPKLVNLLLDTVFVVDKAGRIVFISDACEQLVGYTPAEMTGRELLDFIHPDDLENTLNAAQKVMSGEPQNNFENRYLRKDGSTVNILWSANWNQEEQLRIAVARDVTALRKADQTRNALYRISEAAHDADTLRALCSGLQQVIGELFPGDDLNIAFFDSNKNVLRVPDWARDHPDGWLETTIESGTALARVLAGNQPWPEFRADRLGIPLISRDSVLGLLTLEKSSKEASFDSADRKLLEFVATQVATMVERKLADEELRFRAHHDPLTGLTNRSVFYDRLESALQSARQNTTRLAVLYLDLNDFKSVNDTWGHEAGDELIRQVARRLESGTRQTDTIGRMGGDEFTVLLTDIAASPTVVEKAVGKIREMMSAPVDFAGETFSITCSIGVAIFPEDGDSARQLMVQADSNMYVNKYGA